jgi:hypothetical protein
MVVTQSGWMAVEVTQSDLPVFCQGEVVTLTANVTGTPAVAYLWSTGETTQSIEVGASGTYDVTVTNILGCHAYDTYTTVFNISDLLSSYIILARKEVKLEGTKIYDLGVGVKDNKGKIKVKHQSQITAPGTFARAHKVEVDNSSMVTDIILPGCCSLA